MLPNINNNSKKINAGITGQFPSIDGMTLGELTSQSSVLEVYFIPESTIDYYSLPNWLKGCNSIGDYHPHHVTSNLTALVEKKPVNLLSIATYMTQYQVRNIKLLKIDTEGFDVKILNELADYLTIIVKYCLLNVEENGIFPPSTSTLYVFDYQVMKWNLQNVSIVNQKKCTSFYPDRVVFESNYDLTDQNIMESVVNKFLYMGIYTVSNYGNDQILEKLEQFM